MSIKYQMWLTYNAEKEKIQLPVLPETFKTNNGSSNDSMDITGLGEIIIMQSRPALQFSFSSFFPAARFPGLQVSSITKPLELVQKINTWKASKKPVHFIATACGVDLYCAIEKFNYSEEGGDPGTYQYDITLKEYREITVRQVKVDGKQQLTMPEVYAANVNSVVSINVSTTTNVFGRTTESAASGSGFFITKDGYILTNYHVIEGASTVKVTAYDGTTYDAAVIGGDEDYDIAVIKVEGTNFQPVVIGKSGSVQIGETVAAVGNPLGELTFSMSQGIVSCVNRAINVDGKPFNMIQVDCSINPGNSGGPLFNSYGEVIGIVSAKYSSYSNTTVEGIGFAIPIDDVLAMVKDIMTDGYVTNKPYIGITPQNMTAQMAQQYRYDVTQGVFVCSVEPGSAAEKAGLQMGDVITKIGDTAISDMNDLNAAKKSYRAGDTVTLTIYRAGGTKEVELTFDAVPQTQETAQDNSQQQQQGGSNGGYYYNPWDFFNSFFGNGYYGSSYSGESRDAA